MENVRFSAITEFDYEREQERFQEFQQKYIPEPGQEFWIVSSGGTDCCHFVLATPEFMKWIFSQFYGMIEEFILDSPEWPEVTETIWSGPDQNVLDFTGNESEPENPYNPNFKLDSGIFSHIL